MVPLALDSGRGPDLWFSVFLFLLQALSQELGFRISGPHVLWKVILDYIPLTFSMFCNFTELSFWCFTCSAENYKKNKDIENTICY